MKKLVLGLLLAVNLIGFQAQAEVDAGDFLDLIGGLIESDRRDDRDNGYYPPPGYGPIRCTYVDEGHEEHSRGHRSCGECLSFHGNCIESCFSEVTSCRATGIDYSGRPRSVYAEDQDRWYAERRALEYCRYEGLRDCRVDRCDRRQSQVSNRLCR